MTVKLTSNFLRNARGITFLDGSGVVWSINKSTNEVTTAVAGALGGTVTSVGLADGSTAPIYTISGSPVVGAGTLTFTLATQVQKTFFAGPTSGANAQPTFRVIAVADVPTLNQNTTGSSASCTGNAAGLSATLVATSGGTGQAVYAVGDLLYASTTTALSRLADVATGQYLRSGGVNTAPAWGVILAADLPANGANPAATTGTAAINGSASTWMRSDGAPAIDLTMAPTWSGIHTFAASRVVIAPTAAGEFFRCVAHAAGNAQYQTWFDSNGSTRRGYFGFDSNGTSNLTWANEISGGNLVLSPGAAGGVVNITSALGVNNNAAPAQVTGWGTPAGPAVVATFPAVPTLAQCGQAIGQLIKDLKAFGLYAA